jgi:hypothetical protein
MFRFRDPPRQDNVCRVFFVWRGYKSSLEGEGKMYRAGLSVQEASSWCVPEQTWNPDSTRLNAPLLQIWRGVPRGLCTRTADLERDAQQPQSRVLRR